MRRKFTSRKPIPVSLFGAYFCNYNRYKKISLAVRKVRVLLLIMIVESNLGSTQLNALVGEMECLTICEEM